MDDLSSMASPWQQPMTFTQRQKRERAAVKQMTKKVKEHKAAHQHQQTPTNKHHKPKGMEASRVKTWHRCPAGIKVFYRHLKKMCQDSFCPLISARRPAPQAAPAYPLGRTQTRGKWLHLVTGAAFERLPGRTILGGKGVGAGTPSRGLQAKRRMNPSTIQVRCLVCRGKRAEWNTRSIKERTFQLFQKSYLMYVICRSICPWLICFMSTWQ